MKRIRIIPLLLFENDGLTKTVQFNQRTYVGDPINAIKIFNEKEVDELIFIDIEASAKKKQPNFKLISEIATECFMPLSYGGGITNIEEIKTILSSGVEKVCLGNTAFFAPELITEAARRFGNQSIVVSIDVRFIKGDYRVFVNNGKIDTHLNVVEYAQKMELLGSGELLLQSIDRDGKQNGYDNSLIELVSNAVEIPVIIAGGANSMNDFEQGIKHGASAVAAGSLFVFYGKHRAILINTPSKEEFDNLNNSILKVIKK
jgi:cyclase